MTPACIRRRIGETFMAGCLVVGLFAHSGVFLDPKREAAIRFTMDRPGRNEFRCSIHPNMKGELLLLNVEAV